MSRTENKQETRPLNIYISGKIGEEVISAATRRKFIKARDALLKEGYRIYDPTDEKFQEELREHVGIEEEKWKDLTTAKFDRYAWILLYDLHFLALCDAILMLEDWRDSPGARSEHEFAKSTGKKIFYARYQDAENLLWHEFCSLPESDGLSLSEGCKRAKEYTNEHIHDHYIPVI